MFVLNHEVLNKVAKKVELDQWYLDSTVLGCVDLSLLPDNRLLAYYCGPDNVRLSLNRPVSIISTKPCRAKGGLHIYSGFLGVSFLKKNILTGNAKRHLSFEVLHSSVIGLQYSYISHLLAFQSTCRRIS